MFVTKQYTITKQRNEPKVEMEEDLPKPKPPPKKMVGKGLDELINKIKDVTLQEPRKSSKITF